MSYQVRNIETGEIAPAHVIGTNEDNLPVIQFAEGWEPAFPYETDEDGNWIAINTTEDF